MARKNTPSPSPSTDTHRAHNSGPSVTFCAAAPDLLVAQAPLVFVAGRGGPRNDEASAR